MILSAPQTPLLKSKLSLDIPPNYSGVNTPSSVRSPSLSPLPSPTLSGSWNVNKTQAELTVFLKDAYRMIREKERDLTLAAEIGKNLLENNVALKAKCEALVAQLQKLQRQNQKASAFTIKAHATEKPSAVPIAPPSSSLDPFGDESCDYEESDSESINGWSSSHEMSPSISAMKRSHSKRDNHQNQQSSLTFKELEIIKDLELRNQDLQARLDEVIKEYNETDKIDKTKIRVLESELERSQEMYTQAAERIEVLEEDKKLLSQKQSSDFWQNKYSKKSLENDEIIENLMNKVTELEQQNIQIERQKAETEKKLHKVTSELDALREHCDQLIDESRDYGMLQVEAKQKQELIDELSESLEYERSKIVSLRSSGMYSRPSSRSNSFSENTYNTLRRLSNPDRSLFGAAPQTPTTGPTHSSGGLGGLGVKIKRTLLSELENEWYRELTFQQKSIENDDDEPPSFSEKDLSEFFINNGARSDLFDDDDDISRLDYLSDSEFSFFDEFDTDNEKAVRIREWFWKRWVKSVYAFFRLIWRWVKFILILFAANIMALYRGPDDILPEDVYN